MSIYKDDTDNFEYDQKNTSQNSFFSKIQGNSDISYINHSPIRIENNSDFSLYSFPGNGTVDNPYIIENLSISNGSISNIVIINSSAHFIIRNFVLDGISGNYTGISLTNVSNAQIINNSISKTSIGIFLFEF